MATVIQLGGCLYSLIIVSRLWGSLLTFPSEFLSPRINESRNTVVDGNGTVPDPTYGSRPAAYSRYRLKSRHLVVLTHVSAPACVRFLT